MSEAARISQVMSRGGPGLAIDSLRQAYTAGILTPASVVASIKEKIERTRDYNIWISVVDDARMQPLLDRLDAADPATLPLYGIPFAIKDNIDLAGVPTTAACPGFAYTPAASAFAVELLLQAGALPVGKTNLDQLATGLVGTRSPWGATHNALLPDYISGGSSAGSAVAVALGQASFALGTDTAGSGRVPAAFNQLVGYKPTRGVLGMSGVVPACRTLDCLSVFAASVGDARQVTCLLSVEDSADPFARRGDFPRAQFRQQLQDASSAGSAFRFGVPQRDQLRFFGHGDYEARFERCVARLQALGGTVQETDFAPFLQAAELLYAGPWVAERYLVAKRLMDTDADQLRPELRHILGGASAWSATDTFAALYRLQELKLQADHALAGVDFMLTPTAGGCFTHDEIALDPIGLNSRLGYYTNFMNLLDYAAVAIPGDVPQGQLPFGVTLFAAAGSDAALLRRAESIMPR